VGGLSLDRKAPLTSPLAATSARSPPKAPKSQLADEKPDNTDPRQEDLMSKGRMESRPETTSSVVSLC